MLLFRFVALLVLRFDTRRFVALLFQLPPRNTPVIRGPSPLKSVRLKAALE
jgi:hypothetical protein